ncbi:MAG: hypothetical protein ACFFD2_05925 [Promethearchaeota archaeon]
MNSKKIKIFTICFLLIILIQPNLGPFSAIFYRTKEGKDAEKTSLDNIEESAFNGFKSANGIEFTDLDQLLIENLPQGELYGALPQNSINLYLYSDWIESSYIIGGTQPWYALDRYITSYQVSDTSYLNVNVGPYGSNTGAFGSDYFPQYPDYLPPGFEEQFPYLVNKIFMPTHSTLSLLDYPENPYQPDYGLLNLLKRIGGMQEIHVDGACVYKSMAIPDIDKPSQTQYHRPIILRLKETWDHYILNHDATFLTEDTVNGPFYRVDHEYPMFVIHVPHVKIDFDIESAFVTLLNQRRSNVGLSTVSNAIGEVRKMLGWADHILDLAIDPSIPTDFKSIVDWVNFIASNIFDMLNMPEWLSIMTEIIDMWLLLTSLNTAGGLISLLMSSFMLDLAWQAQYIRTVQNSLLRTTTNYLKASLYAAAQIAIKVLLQYQPYITIYNVPSGENPLGLKEPAWYADIGENVEAAIRVSDGKSVNSLNAKRWGAAAVYGTLNMPTSQIGDFNGDGVAGNWQDIGYHGYLFGHIIARLEEINNQESQAAYFLHHCLTSFLISLLTHLSVNTVYKIDSTKDEITGMTYGMDIYNILYSSNPDEIRKRIFGAFVTFCYTHSAFKNKYGRNTIWSLNIKVTKDSDGDGLTDDQEDYYKSDPNNPDSDSDGLLDGDEAKYWGHPKSSQRGWDDPDHDGYTNSEEIYGLKTNPKSFDADLDNDGLHYNLDPNPRKRDTDNDNLIDGDEYYLYGTSVTKADTDGDGLRDDLELRQYGTNPKKKDTDGDGLTDDYELATDSDPTLKDTEGDGLNDGDEVFYGTNRRDKDSDDDKLLDGWEVSHGYDPTDRQDPPISISINFPAQPTVTNPGEFSWSISDISPRIINSVIIKYKVTSGEWQTISTSTSGSYPLQPVPGTHSVQISARNNVGTETTKTKSVVVTEGDDDTTGPIITIIYTGDETDGNPGIWSVSAVDPESGIDWIEVSIDGTLVGTISGNYPVPNTLGVHIISVTAANADLDTGPEDQETSNKSSTINIVDDDVTGPNIIISYSGDATDSNPGFWTVSATDPESGVDSFVVEIDGTFVGTSAGDYTVPNTLGPHTISVTAINADLDRGPIDQESTTVLGTITILDDDLTGPIVTISYSGEATDGNPGIWTVSAVDPESGIDFIAVFIDGTLIGTSEGDYAVPNSLGMHNISVTAVNADIDTDPEDQESTTESSAINITDDDVTGPNISISYNGDAMDSNPGFWTVSATDPESGIGSFVVEIDGTFIGTSAGDYAVPNTLGPHTILVTATNADLDRGPIDQESTTVSDTITILDDDLTGPIVTISYSGDATDGNPGIWTVSAMDLESGIELISVIIDGILVGTSAGDYAVPNTLGPHTILVTATNADLDRGPIDQESTTVSDTITILDDDQTGPIVTISYSGDATDRNPGIWTVSAVDLESGIESISVFIDGILVGTSIGNYAVPNTLGSHTILVIVTNADLDRGPIDQESTTVSDTITILDDDLTGPIVTISYSGDATDGNPGIWTVSAVDPESGIDMISVFIDGTLIGASVGDYAVPNSLGRHNISITATNNDKDRGIVDQETTIESDIILIVDDDTTGPKLENFTVEIKILEIKISIIATDESGIGLFEFNFDGDLVEPMNQTQLGSYYLFYFENTWIMEYDTHNLVVTVWDTDNDRPDDSSASIITESFEITIEQMINYTLIELADLKAEVEDRVCVLFEWLITQRLDTAKCLINSAYSVYLKGCTPLAIILDKLAKANIELANVITIILDLIGFISENDGDFILNYLHSIRDHITLIMGALIGTENSMKIAQIECTIDQLADDIFKKYRLCISLPVSTKLWIASENLDFALIWLTINCEEQIIDHITKSIQALNCTIDLINNFVEKGKIPLDEAQQLINEINGIIIELNNLIEALYL